MVQYCTTSYCKTASHITTLYEAVTELSNLDLLSQADHLARQIAALLLLFADCEADL